MLGVAPVSEDVVIAAAYRALMRRYHPDTNKDATAQQKAREINEAYGVLGDAAKRAEYDRQRAPSQAGRAQQQRNSGQGSSKAAGPKPSASAGAGAAPRQCDPARQSLPTTWLAAREAHPLASLERVILLQQ